MNPEYVGAHFLDFSLLRDSFCGWWDKYCRVFSVSVIGLGFLVASYSLTELLLLSS